MQPNKKKGFTLVEVVVVLVVVGIMALAAAPNFESWRVNMQLKAAARDLYSDMQQARILAIKSNGRSAVSFFPGTNQYKICDDWDTTSNACAGTERVVDLSTLRYGIGFGHGTIATELVSGEGFPTNNVSYTNDVVIFNTQGIGNAGYVYLDHQDDTTTYAVGSQTSGVIELLKWQGGGWE